MAHKIVIDGIIGGWNIDGRYIRNELEKAGGKDVYVEIASPGGFVFDGIEIFNLFKNYSGNVHMHIIGLAASMASYIPLAGNKITAEENAVFMIHNVWSFAIGDYRDLEKEIKLLKGLTDILAKAYVNKTGKSLNEVKRLMNEETFFFGNEIIENGFIDEIIPVDKKVDTKDESLAFAKLQIEDCMAKMKEKENREDIQKAAAWLNKLPETSEQDKKNENKLPENNKMDSFNNKPAESGKKEEVSMNLETLKAQHSDLYNSVIQAGIDQERERTAAHMEWIDVAPEAVKKAITEGEKFTSAHLSTYTKASLNKQEVKNMTEDNPENIQTPTNEKDVDAIENEINSRVAAGLDLKEV